MIKRKKVNRKPKTTRNSTIGSELKKMSREERIDPVQCFKPEFLRLSASAQDRILKGIRKDLQNVMRTVTLINSKKMLGQPWSPNAPKKIQEARKIFDQTTLRLAKIATQEYFKLIEGEMGVTDTIGRYWHQTAHQLKDLSN